MTTVVMFFSLLTSKAPDSINSTFFRFRRAVAVSAVPSSDACVLLDRDVLAHTDATLADLRLYDATDREIPYAITLSRTLTIADTASLLNARLSAPNHLSIDLAMPARPYSAVELTFTARDFIASVHVTGLRALGDLSPVFLGNFNLFDLTAQGLGRNTNLALAESTFPLLHLDLSVTPAGGHHDLRVTPQLVAAANVPPSRVAQTLYTPVAETTTILQRPRESVALLSVPAHLPVERVSVVLDPAERSNFSRTLTLSATLTNPARRGAVFPVEQISGEISRVHLTQSGERIDEQTLSVPAILGSNAQSAATVEVAIENGEEHPLKLRAVRLEMRQRKLCFAVPPSPVALLYGASSNGTAGVGTSAVPSPEYDYPRLFNASAPAALATLADEQLNPRYRPHILQKPFNERYPRLLWAALLSSFFVLSFVAVRSARRQTG